MAGGAGALIAGASAWTTGRGAVQGPLPGKSLRIGYAVERPYAYIAGERVTGACVETARLVAAGLGFQIEWVLVRLEELIPDLQDGRFDLVSAGLFVTPERARIVQFAQPELRVTSGLLVRRDNPRAPRSYDDVRTPQQRTAALAGSTEAFVLQGLPSADLLLVPDPLVGAQAVQRGMASSLALSWPAVRQLAARDPELEAVPIEAPGMTYLVAAAFRASNRELLASWQRGQAAVLGSPAHLQAITAFGFTEADLPSATRRTPGTA